MGQEEEGKGPPEITGESRSRRTYPADPYSKVPRFPQSSSYGSRAIKKVGPVCHDVDEKTMANIILRPVVRMEDTGLSQAEQNQLASGFRSANSTFGSNMIASLDLSLG